ncbi:MAG: hypothetical protein LBQ14_09020 [Treponema sp.]|jgi:hypothetical protein|nr:hypothetical protein [Treponema sp.]
MDNPIIPSGGFPAGYSVGFHGQILLEAMRPFDLSCRDGYNGKVIRFEKRVGIILLIGCMVPVYAQEAARSTLPDALKRPQRGEAPRYPRDAVIGELGRGEAREEAYAFARNLLQDLLGGRRDSPFLEGFNPDALEGILALLEGIGAEKFRIGGGREEPDESTSFLVRFLGPEQGAAGELYLRTAADRWRLDDLTLEEPRDIAGSLQPRQFDFAPYERFF